MVPVYPTAPAATASADIPVPVAATAAATPAATTAAATVPDTATMTTAFAAPAPAPSAQGNDIFHGLFSDPGRTSPVAAVVSQLWGVANTPAGVAGAPAASMLGLFKDDGDDERGT